MNGNAGGIIKEGAARQQRNVVTMRNKAKTNMHKNQASCGHKCIIDMQLSAWDEKNISERSTKDKM